MAPVCPPTGAGLGWRRELIAALDAGVPPALQFFELAPENWAGAGGRSARELRAMARNTEVAPLFSMDSPPRNDNRSSARFVSALA